MPINQGRRFSQSCFATAKSFASALAFLLCQQALAAPPIIEYRTSAGADGRMFIFSNNPENLLAEPGQCDLADAQFLTDSGQSVACATSILRIERILGTYRDWWEHLNKTPQPLFFAVRLTNEGVSTAKITVTGIGETDNSLWKGGNEFVQLFSTHRQTLIELHAGQSAFIFRSAAPYQPGDYFTGVVDFSVAGGAVTLENLAFVREPASELTYSGFVQRVMGTTHDGLVYKGMSPYTEARIDSADFTIGDADTGLLQVQYPLFQLPSATSAASCQTETQPYCRGDLGNFQATNTLQNHWITHIGLEPTDSNPKRKRAVMTDMVPFFMPGFPAGCSANIRDGVNNCVEISPYYKWFVPSLGKWLYPNIANWGVHYKFNATIKNSGSRTRRVHLGLRSDAHSPIAYRGNDGVWRQKTLKRPDQNNWEDYFSYSWTDVPPGETVPLQGDFILSGPASGTLEQFVRVVN
jgi:hypothetical protein